MENERGPMELGQTLERIAKDINKFNKERNEYAQARLNILVKLVNRINRVKNKPTEALMYPYDNDDSSSILLSATHLFVKKMNDHIEMFNREFRCNIQVQFKLTPYNPTRANREVINETELDKILFDALDNNQSSINVYL